MNPIDDNSFATSAKSKHILVVNLSNPLSHGGAAIAISLLGNLNTMIPGAEVSLMATRDIDVSVYTSKYGFSQKSFVRHTWFRSRKSQLASLMASAGPAVWALLSCVSYNFSSRFGVKGRSIYDAYDIVLDLSSDSLNEYYGIVYPLFSLFELGLVLLCNKKVVVCPASIGPFKNRIVKRLVRRVLSKTDLVIAREETTRDFLSDLGIPEGKIHLAADLAFLFESAPKKRAEEIATAAGVGFGKRPLVGVAPSSEIFRYCFPEVSETQYKYLKYVKLMAEVTDFIVEEFDVDVVFIPHFIFPDEFIKNDKVASQDIYDHVKNKERVKLLLDDYRADEVKGVIGLCDMLLSCRMHAAIASTSSTVPTVALSFGHKFNSVLGKMLGQDRCIVESDSDYSMVLTNLKRAVVYAWDNRVSIRKELDSRRMVVKERALSSFVKVKELLDE